MKKQTDRAFGKNIYLLGKSTEGRKLWLEAPSWDCGWYWGFGYVETYTNNRAPSKSRDIQSHEHIDGFIGEKMKKSGEYCHNIYDSKKFAKTTFNENEGWELSELFKRFYTLRETANIFHNGAGISSSTVNTTSKELANEINEKYIPAVTARILEILTPNI